MESSNISVWKLQSRSKWETPFLEAEFWNFFSSIFRWDELEIHHSYLTVDFEFWLLKCSATFQKAFLVVGHFKYFLCLFVQSLLVLHWNCCQFQSRVGLANLVTLVGLVGGISRGKLEKALREKEGKVNMFSICIETDMKCDEMRWMEGTFRLQINPSFEQKPLGSFRG